MPKSMNGKKLSPVEDRQWKHVYDSMIAQGRSPDAAGGGATNAVKRRRTSKAAACEMLKLAAPEPMKKAPDAPAPPAPAPQLRAAPASQPMAPVAPTPTPAAPAPMPQPRMAPASQPSGSMLPPKAPAAPSAGLSQYTTITPYATPAPAVQQTPASASPVQSSAPRSTMPEGPAPAPAPAPVATAAPAATPTPAPAPAPQRQLFRTRQNDPNAIRYPMIPRDPRGGLMREPTPREYDEQMRLDRDPNDVKLQSRLVDLSNYSWPGKTQADDAAIEQIKQETGVDAIPLPGQPHTAKQFSARIAIKNLQRGKGEDWEGNQMIANAQERLGQQGYGSPDYNFMVGSDQASLKAVQDARKGVVDMTPARPGINRHSAADPIQALNANSHYFYRANTARNAELQKIDEFAKNHGVDPTTGLRASLLSDLQDQRTPIVDLPDTPDNSTKSVVAGPTILNRVQNLGSSVTRGLIPKAAPPPSPGGSYVRLPNGSYIRGTRAAPGMAEANAATTLAHQLSQRGYTAAQIHQYAQEHNNPALAQMALKALQPYGVTEEGPAEDAPANKAGGAKRAAAELGLSPAPTPTPAPKTPGPTTFTPPTLANSGGSDVPKLPKSLKSPLSRKLASMIKHAAR